jgi:crotonobetainyl-CoA:carnitine CoA-transferase CaiB-like acyl-CoA transferase
MCTKVFADFGADVIKVEPPGTGDPTRLIPPFIGGQPDAERSAVFLHLNTNKRSLVLDISSTPGLAIFERLVAGSDIVVETFKPGTLEGLGLGWEHLRAINPRLILTRITAFGQTGPYRDFEATDLVLDAMGGTMSSNGIPGLGPLRKPGRISLASIGIMAAEATLAAYMGTLRQGKGQEVDVAGFEVLLGSLDRRRAGLVTAAYSGANEPQFSLRQLPPQRVFPCADGLVMVFVTRHFLGTLLALLGDRDLIDYYSAERLKDMNLYSDEAEIELVEHRLRSWLQDRTKYQIMAEAERGRVPITAVLDFGEVLRDPHFRARGIFHTLDHPVVGPLEYVGPPWRMEDGWRMEHPAPLLGQHTEEVMAEIGFGNDTVGWQPGGGDS